MMDDFQSWGKYPPTRPLVRPVSWRHQALDLPPEGQSCLPRGNGRSYGDVCLNRGGWLLSTRSLDHFMAFDQSQAILTCESGVTLDQALAFCAARGWTLPVTPGTSQITVGGAIANDVHGKNHHQEGTFGRHVLCFELLRSDGRRLLCSPESNPQWFAATIGGLGLTGLITWAQLRLRPLASPFLRTETIKFRSVEEFVRLSLESDRDWSHTVAWADVQVQGANLGRGHFMRGNFLPANPPGARGKKDGLGPGVPFDLPPWLLNRVTMRAFNSLYYHKQKSDLTTAIAHYRDFFYPLDSIPNWNRMYGRRGFMQFQCLVPVDQAAVIRELLALTARSGQGSFLAVIKMFGDLPSPGLLSFPRPGVTLTLDCAIKPRKTFQLFRDLTQLVRQCGGRLYPAKDACMSAQDYDAFYPRWRELTAYADPRFSSSFWRRVTGEGSV